MAGLEIGKIPTSIGNNRLRIVIRKVNSHDRFGITQYCRFPGIQ